MCLRIHLGGLVSDNENSRLPGIVGYFSPHVAPAAVCLAVRSYPRAGPITMGPHRPLALLVLAVLRHAVRTRRDAACCQRDGRNNIKRTSPGRRKKGRRGNVPPLAMVPDPGWAGQPQRPRDRGLRPNPSRSGLYGSHRFFSGLLACACCPIVPTCPAYALGRCTNLPPGSPGLTGWPRQGSEIHRALSAVLLGGLPASM